MNKEQAIAMAESKWWEGKTAQEIAVFQLNEDLLCMPFNVFHKAVEEWLGRPVWTHEFVSPEELITEGHCESYTRNMGDVIGKAQELMGDKPVIIVDAT